MRASGFSPRQSRVVLLMVLIVVAVFALLAGFLVTSLESLQPARSPTPWTPSLASSPSPTSSLPPATPTPALEEGLWPQVRAARLFDQIAHQVETIRLLSPRAEVPLSFLDEEQMEDALAERYSEDAPPAMVQPLTALGLLPEAPVEIEAQAPAGIYVSEQQQLYVATDRSDNDRDGQVLLAHAYVHALQDQHFDLEAVHARAQTTDEKLAVQALIEGDATLATALYSSADLPSVDWQGLVDLIVAAEHPRYGDALASCAAWAKLERFPNQEGRLFANAVVEHGGWEALNGCYAELPRSTEQILHPSRYLGLTSQAGEPDQPSTVIVPDLQPVLGEAWRPVVRDTLGEYAIGLSLSQVMPEAGAWRSADGWDGDTFVVWEHEDGQRIVIWRTIWSTSAEASEYERAMTLLIPQRHLPAQPIDPPRGLPGRWWASGRGTVHLLRTARYVLFIRAPDSNTAVNVLQLLP